MNSYLSMSTNRYRLDQLICGNARKDINNLNLLHPNLLFSDFSLLINRQSWIYSTKNSGQANCFNTVIDLLLLGGAVLAEVQNYAFTHTKSLKSYFLFPSKSLLCLALVLSILKPLSYFSARIDSPDTSHWVQESAKYS